MSKSYEVHSSRTGLSRAGARILAALLAPALVLVAAQAMAATPEDLASQSPLARQVEAVRGKADALQRVSVFQMQTQSASRDADTGRALSSGTLVELDAKALATLRSAQPRSMTLVLPTRERGDVELELVQHDIFAPDFKVEASGGEDTKGLSRGLHYRGVVKGEPDSFAAISLFEHEVMGTFSMHGDGNWVVGRLDGANRGDRHVVYAETSLKDKSLAPTCAMDEKGKPASFADYWQDETAAKPAAAPAAEGDKTVKCATEWLEAEYDVYTNRGSMQATTDFLTGIFNNSSTIYANDGITLKLQQLYIWTTADPYNGSSSTANLTSFQSSRASSFAGTIAQLVTFRSLGGGVAAGFSGICNANRSASMCTSGINTSYSSVPTYSWTVSVITHEAGHLLGSRHTHACVWNGNNTAIDSCAGSTEGGCPLPGIPSGGGTIMSYCHLTSTGINFNKGFGTQPATTIRNRVEAGSCLGNCDGGPGGGETALTNYNAYAGISGAANAQRVFKIDVPAGTQALSFNTWGGTGDVDIYVKQGSVPTTGNATCQSTTPTTAEACRVNSPAAGTWYVLVLSYAASSNVNLSAAFAGGCAGTLEVGALAATNAQAYAPAAGSYTSAGSGTHAGTSRGPSDADFELELQKQSGSTWSKVAESTSSTSSESASYNGTAGTYRWRAYSYSGSGGYSVCFTKPN